MLFRWVGIFLLSSVVSYAGVVEEVRSAISENQFTQAKTALDAYHASLHGQPAPVLNGLTGDQRVFLGWAQAWRGKLRDDAIRRQVASDPHSHRKFRVNGVVRNIDAWYDTFSVTPEQKLYVAPDQRVHIW